MARRLVLLLALVTVAMACSPCPFTQSNSPKDDVCRRDKKDKIDTYIFEGLVRTTREIVDHSNEIIQNINEEIKFDVEITKIYQDVLNSLTVLKEPRLITLKVDDICQPMCNGAGVCGELQVGKNYLLAVNTNLLLSRCNVVKLADQVTPGDTKWLNGTYKCQ